MVEKSLLERRFNVLGKHSPLFYEEPLHIVRGEGVWVYDINGQRYLDAYNNVPHVGHCHPHVVEALSKQAATLNTHTRYLHENIVQYAERVVATFDDSLSMMMLACTGSEANEVAIRMARQHTNGMGLICTSDTYHGNTASVFELGTTFKPENAAPALNVRAIPPPDSYRALKGQEGEYLQGEALADAYANEVQKAIDSFTEAGIKLAAAIFCPAFANEGMLNIPDGFMAKAISKVRDAGGLYIADEVQAGFGRTGHHWWAHQWDSVIPDIVTMGKPMGNGHPISGVVSSADLIDEFGASGMYFNTFGGNPVSCAVGNAVLDVLEDENLLQNAVTIGDYVNEGLQKLLDKHDLIGDVRNKGMFFAAELVTDRTTRTPATIEAKQVVQKMLENNILISKIGRHGHILKMRPPMPFAKEHADLLLSTLDDAFSSL
jgi:4-aminobutyrate aminotransferase-like enzyme